MYFYEVCRRWPERAKRFIRDRMAPELPPGIDADVHFKPTYEPWDQRVCLVPDNDLFRAMRAGRVSVVTDHVSRLTRTGVLLASGQELPADIIVTATGLKLLACGGIKLRVDGSDINLGEAFSYKGVMLSNVPNFALSTGYTNASWTLRSELSAAYVCRLFDYMDRRGYTRCVPRCDTTSIEGRPLLGLTSGYVQRGAGQFPKQGQNAPWVMPQNYILDLLNLHFGSVDDGTLVFS
jgi:cation diffusion facilitator CzcD-associated flavoprotein CzcO